MKKADVIIRKVLAITLVGILCPVVYAQPVGNIRPTAPVRLPQSEFLFRSGVAYDASEDLLGLIHIQEPKSFFKPDTDQITWWGEFKPFKTWGRPELVAKWYDPQGRLASTQEFKGTICRLAKATLKTANLNLQENQGQWRVEIYMKDRQIDSKNFYVFSPGSGPPVQSQATVTVQAPQAR